MNSRPIRLLTFSTLYPNHENPNHGVFVENRLRHLVAAGGVSSTVVAPLPYFPSTSHRFGAWSRDARVATTETRHGLSVHHPRFPAIPRVGMSAAPFLLYWASLRAIRRLMAAGLQFDIIDAHYVYPDGVAAVWLGRALGRPVVITARGSDVSQLPQYAVPRRLIQGAIDGAAGLVGVSAAIKTALVELGADADRVEVLRNGVDTSLFRPPENRLAARATVGFDGPTLLSVGHLIERKGHHRVIEAMASLPDHRLAIAGDGPERPRLLALIARLGLGDRVRLLGTRPHPDLPELYGAADALVLASSREGWANVLLEAMACGTPVVASNIWGNPEVVQTRDAGVIADQNTPDGIAAAVRDLLGNPPNRAATRAYAEGFSWDATTAGQRRLFEQVLGAADA